MTDIARSPASSRDHAAGARAALRARIALIEGTAQAAGDIPTLPLAPVLGSPAIDAALPWGGLPLGVLHEVGATSVTAAAATGFCAALLARLAGPVLWVTREDRLHGPGLAGFGLGPAHLIVARAHRQRDVLWAVEEGLRMSRLAAVLGEVDAVDLRASRRLQLAAETSGVTAILLRRAGELTAMDQSPPSAAVTRWRVSPAADPGSTPLIGPPRWRLALLRCRGGRPGAWTVQYRHREKEHEEGDETDRLAPPAIFRHRSAVSPRRTPAERRTATG